MAKAIPLSYQLVERVRKAISNQYLTASDSKVAKELDVSRSAVSAWKAGRDVMGPEPVARVAEILGLSGIEMGELGLLLMAEAYSKTKDPKVLRFAAELRELVDQLKSGAASILLGTIAVLGLTALPAQRVAAAVPEAPHARSEYYVKSRIYVETADPELMSRKPESSITSEAKSYFSSFWAPRREKVECCCLSPILKGGS